jgi:hypothetical protein
VRQPYRIPSLPMSTCNDQADSNPSSSKEKHAALRDLAPASIFSKAYQSPLQVAQGSSANQQLNNHNPGNAFRFSPSSLSCSSLLPRQSCCFAACFSSPALRRGLRPARVRGGTREVVAPAVPPRLLPGRVVPARLALGGHPERQPVDVFGLPRLRAIDLVELVQDARARRAEDDVLAPARVGEDHVAAHSGFVFIFHLCGQAFRGGLGVASKEEEQTGSSEPSSAFYISAAAVRSTAWRLLGGAGSLTASATACTPMGDHAAVPTPWSPAGDVWPARGQSEDSGGSRAGLMANGRRGGKDTRGRRDGLI